MVYLYVCGLPNEYIEYIRCIHPYQHDKRKQDEKKRSDLKVFRVTRTTVSYR